MKIQDSSALGALAAPAKTATHNTASSASFADTLKLVQDASPEINPSKLWKEAFKNYTDAMRDRIEDVGFQHYVTELRQVKKLMQILSILHADGPDNVKDEIEKIMEDFKASPPKTIEEMISRIQQHVDSIPDSAPNKLKERMKQMMFSIAQMMTMGDDAVENLARLKGGPAL